MCVNYMLSYIFSYFVIYFVPWEHLLVTLPKLMSLVSLSFPMRPSLRNIIKTFISIFIYNLLN